MVERRGYAEGEPCWADVVAPDVAAAKRFYGDLFGWTFVDTGPEFGNYVMCLKKGKTVAALAPPMSQDGAAPVWHTYLKTADANAAAQHIDAAGGKLLTGPIEIPDSGRMLVALDPGGAAFGAWEPGNMTGAQLYGEPGAITWAEVNTRDPDRVDAFYHGLFGVEAVAWQDIPEEYPVDAPAEQLGDGMDYAIYKGLGDGPILCGRVKMTAEFGEVPAHWMIYFGVDDADRAAERVTDGGGRVAVAPFDTPYGRMTVVADPNGAVLGLSAAAIAKSRVASWARL